jgi:hypothetical protein
MPPILAQVQGKPEAEWSLAGELLVPKGARPQFDWVSTRAFALHETSNFVPQPCPFLILTILSTIRDTAHSAC